MRRLSYAWGAPGSTRNILLNDRLIPIRENLEAALRQLRRRDRPRTMWVDGICIDQSNVQERTEQVQQMDRTYRNATGVVVWIGRESNTTARLFDRINVTLKDSKQLQDLMRQSGHFLDFPFQPEKYCPHCDGVPRDVASQLVRPFVTERAADRYTKAARDTTITEQEWKNVQVEDIDAFLTLLSRPWWKRVWVLQEAILAKSITLYCGSKSIDWPLLQSILYTYVRQGKRSRIHHIGGLVTEARRARAHSHLLAAVNSTFAFFFLQSSSIPTDQLQGLSMADLLSLTWNFDATDPRDKIFALIGLLPENCPERVLFKPDYTVNVKQLFLHVAKTFLVTSQRLDVLTARSSLPDFLVPVLGREPGHFGFDGPSWVPNWKSLQIWQVNSIWISDFSPFKTLNWYARTRLLKQRPGHESTGPETIPMESLQVFNASLHDISPFPFEFSEHGEILQIRGLTVDTVEEVGQPWSLGLAALKAYNPANSKESKQNAHDAQVAIIEQWKSIARLDTETDYTFTGQSRNEAFWRTMFLDRYRSTHTHDRLYHICRIPAQVKENEAIDMFSPGGIICDFPPQTADDELGLVYFLRHEVTEMWAFANVNLHCADLSLFRTAKGYIGVGHPNMQPGDKVTILLGAPVPLVLREYEEGHLLIGQSYVHGIMDGEFLQAERDHGRGTKQEDFEMFAII
ncbi:hypothetical protein N7451_010939 [Penicillium sp. IBT 35674x]|nr:hypothetical protein N7451_010939 [Penicillium sp. IBT 35674x]